jgi:hypothetical protein
MSVPDELFFLALQKVKRNTTIVGRVENRTSKLFVVKQTPAGLPSLIAQMGVKLVVKL